MSKLEHGNVIKLRAKVETRHSLMFVMEYAEGGDLFEYIVKHGKVRSDF